VIGIGELHQSWSKSGVTAIAHFTHEVIFFARDRGSPDEEELAENREMQDGISNRNPCSRSDTQILADAEPWYNFPLLR